MKEDSWVEKVIFCSGWIVMGVIVVIFGPAIITRPPHFPFKTCLMFYGFGLALVIIGYIKKI